MHLFLVLVKHVLRGCFGVHSFGCHAGNSSDVTLAFENAQVIHPFARDETDSSDDTDDTDDTDNIDDADDTNDTDDKDDTDDTNHIDDAVDTNDTKKYR